MNPLVLLKLKGMASGFSRTHPKFAEFMKKIYTENLQEGTIIKVIIQTPDGETSSSAMKIRKTDLQLVEDIKRL